MNKNIDIKNLKVAKRYASALCESAKDSLDEVLNDLVAIDEIIFQNDDFKTFFLHPIVSLKDKKDTLKETLEGKINQLTLNFINTLLDESRFNIYKTVLEIFRKEVEIIKNKQRIEVVSVVKLNDKEKEKLQQKLYEKLNKDILLSCEEDKNIMGGLVIKLEDKVIDLSLKTKFEILKKNVY